jgi:hypothetical protein
MTQTKENISGYTTDIVFYPPVQGEAHYDDRCETAVL